MAKLTFAAARDQAINHLEAILASGTNPDGTKFSISMSDGISDSAIGAAVATAPGAGSTIAWIAAGSLPAGVYEVVVRVSVFGNAVGDLNNCKLQRGGVDYVGILPQGASGNSDEIILKRVTLDGTQSLAVLDRGSYPRLSAQVRQALEPWLVLERVETYSVRHRYLLCSESRERPQERTEEDRPSSLATAAAWQSPEASHQSGTTSRVRSTGVRVS
jgi:hypothetical protein